MVKLTHLNADGQAHMVDVGSKDISTRVAVARGYLTASTSDTIDALVSANLPKGEAIGTARLAGIMGAKQTAQLIPLCHPLPISGIEIEINRASDIELCVQATVRVTGKTGVEMEALTAVSTSLLTLYDMAKAIDKAMRFDRIELIEKTGGVSGDYKRL